MKIELKEKGNGTVVCLSGRMDAETAPLFQEQCSALGVQNGARLAVDFSDLEYISSAGLRGILAVGKKLKATNGTLCLCNMNGMVKEVFEISGFTGIFPVFDSTESALESD
ncbi:MAG: STAS domain-containing protein [Desulfovibrionales bacterium]